MIEAGLIAARFAHYVALVLAFGAFAYRGFAAGGAGPRLDRLAVGASVAVAVAALAVLAATIAGLAGDAAALVDASLWSFVVGETDFGRVWSVRLILATGLVATSLLARRARPVATLGLLVAGALLVTVALTGHARIETGTAGLVHRLADALHLAAAGTWLGALVPFVMLLRAGLRSPSAARRCAERLSAFHAIGVAAVLLLIATGLVNSWFLVGTPARLLDTGYGQLLLVKLALFAAMLAFAARNRLSDGPALAVAVSTGVGSDAVLRRLQRRIMGEFLLGLMVLLVVAVLGTIQPAAAGP